MISSKTLTCIFTLAKLNIPFFSLLSVFSSLKNINKQNSCINWNLWQMYKTILIITDNKYKNSRVEWGVLCPSQDVFTYGQVRSWMVEETRVPKKNYQSMEYEQDIFPIKVKLFQEYSMKTFYVTHRNNSSAQRLCISGHVLSYIAYRRYNVQLFTHLFSCAGLLSSLFSPGSFFASFFSSFFSSVATK